MNEWAKWRNSFPLKGATSCGSKRANRARTTTGCAAASRSPTAWNPRRWNLPVELRFEERNDLSNLFLFCHSLAHEPMRMQHGAVIAAAERITDLAQRTF